jgi:surface protein
MLQCLKSKYFLQAPPLLSFKRVGLWLCLLFFTTVTVVDGYAKLPNGDGTTAVTGSTETLRHVVYKWLNSNTRQEVVDLYGPIEDWDTSDITNMNTVFWGVDGDGASTFRDHFNADISKWNMGAVTKMGNSKLLTQFHQKKYLYASLQLTVFLFMPLPCCVAFTHAKAFNRDISTWDTRQVTSMYASTCTKEQC